MIPVLVKPEPAGFEANVRKPGKAFLAINPTPTRKQWTPHWKWAATELYEAYKRVCAYSCTYIPFPSGSIDHFEPVATHPHLACEWGNLRLAIHRINSYKGSSVGLVDPFLVQPHWFVLDFPSCLVRAGMGLSIEITHKIENTIKILKLNDDDSFVQDRCDLMLSFARSEITLEFLRKRYPFLATEIARQGIELTAHHLFKTAN